MSVQSVEFRQVAELRWDGACELIRAEVPKIATRRNENTLQLEGSKYNQ